MKKSKKNRQIILILLAILFNILFVGNAVYKFYNPDTIFTHFSAKSYDLVEDEFKLKFPVGSEIYEASTFSFQETTLDINITVPSSEIDNLISSIKFKYKDEDLLPSDKGTLQLVNGEAVISHEPQISKFERVLHSEKDNMTIEISKSEKGKSKVTLKKMDNFNSKTSQRLALCEWIPSFMRYL